MRNQPIVFFAPYSAIWFHSFPEALVASALKQAGSEIVYVSCNGLMVDHCAAMTARQLSAFSTLEERESICVNCRNRRDALIDGLDVENVTMESLIPSPLKQQLAAFVNALKIDDIENLEVDGFKVGRIALHETILHFKLTSLAEMTQESLADFRIKLLHVLLCLRVAQAILQKLNPTRMVIYNTHVSTNYITMLVAEHFGVPTFGLHAGGNLSKRLSSLYVFRKDMVRLYKDWISHFNHEWSHQPNSAMGIKDAASHFRALTSGESLWVYSAPKRKCYFDVRGHYNIKTNQKILLATLSSYDELFSSQMMGVMNFHKAMFSDQIKWLDALINFVAKRSDLFLLIRVHPRELPNKRDKVHSLHAKKLANFLKNLPKNVKVNWPDEEVSLYDLIPQVDVGLNGWSSTGKELAMLGIPVVLFTDEIIFYPSSLNILAIDQEDYFQKIDHALRDGWSFERIRQVFRWLAVEHSQGTVDIKDGFSYRENIRSIFLRVLRKLRLNFGYRFDTLKINRPLVEFPILAKVILEDASLVGLKRTKQTCLDPIQEDRLLRQEISLIVDSIYSQVPVGISKNIDALREASLG